MVDIQSAAAEIRRGKKKKNKPQDENILSEPLKTWHFIFDYNFG